MWWSFLLWYFYSKICFLRVGCKKHKKKQHFEMKMRFWTCGNLRKRFEKISENFKINGLTFDFFFGIISFILKSNNIQLYNLIQHVSVLMFHVCYGNFSKSFLISWKIVFFFFKKSIKWKSQTTAVNDICWFSILNFEISNIFVTVKCRRTPICIYKDFLFWSNAAIDIKIRS